MMEIRLVINDSGTLDMINVWEKYGDLNLYVKHDVNYHEFAPLYLAYGENAENSPVDGEGPEIVENAEDRETAEVLDGNENADGTSGVGENDINAADVEELIADGLELEDEVSRRKRAAEFSESSSTDSDDYPLDVQGDQMSTHGAREFRGRNDDDEYDSDDHGNVEEDNDGKVYLRNCGNVQYNSKE
ncbi:hypothetical protein CCACVL1_04632 [Corchorus capsularis]|uniref:Uncharacterized protein n=1 Tax=Corchorus capsularis TaxID=210143 RepID=A0A1R3JR36_COCAP|nr:hypothetical protein CCACVL1_04726 [Corchorus capsularis]OMO97201.1 hypothetical protein CCACVL1_04632 [Corchorus capsularis]